MYKLRIGRTFSGKNRGQEEEDLWDLLLIRKKGFWIMIKGYKVET